MPNTIRSVCATFLLLIAGSVFGDAAEPRVLTYADLVRRLTDMRALATPPVAGEMSGSASSYDRASRYDAETDRYIDWRANADGTGFVRMNGASQVAAELEGPGVVWRIWSADPQSGPIRFYVDGAETPALDVPFNQFFNATTGPFPFAQLVREMARGWNCFVPVPYQKSLRIELGEGWGRYYQITYTKFPDGWSVPSFRGALSDDERRELAAADRLWADRGKGRLSDNAERIERDIKIGPGESIDVATLTGAGAISDLRATLDEEDPEEQAALLRELTLSVRWDGEQQPSVWTPLGDFFGSAPGVHSYESLPAGMKGRELRSSWWMPFANGAKVCVTNDGATARKLRVAIAHEQLERSKADNLLRFHAKWRRDEDGAAGPGRFAADRYPDWPVLNLQNVAGRFCGMHLHAWNPLHKWDDALASRYEQPTSELCPDDAWFQGEVIGNRYWYGEGDEKFFVDGERFPSTYGTGTEDYFGFAWGTPALFDSATQAQTVNTNNTGHISLVRYHLADNVPFQTQFEACLEKYHGANWPLQYAVTAYWYQAPGTDDPYKPVPLDKRVGYYQEPTPKK